MNNYTIISDPGIDDLVALVLLYKLMPQAKNNLVSTFGNAPEEITSKNAKEFISFVAGSWSFIHGSKVQLNGAVERPWPDYFHGPDGVWGIHPKVDIQNIETKHNYIPTNKLISLAPLTEPLSFLRKEKIKEITLMGGAFEIEGNETKYAETNIAFDPDAAYTFFKEIKNQKIRVIPLDVTRKVYWSKTDVINIPETNKINKWLKKLLLTWFDKYNHEKEKDFNLHDPLAVYLTKKPQTATWTTNGIKVVTKGEKRGKTIISKNNPPCNIAMSLSNPQEISKDIYSIVFS